MQTSDTLAYLISQGFSKTIIERFWKHVQQTENCWNWKGATIEGYGALNKSTGKNSYLAHRLSWIIHYGPICPEQLCVLHKCDNHPCTRPDHLFLGTRADNHADAVKKNRHAHGETSPSKLKEADVVQILQIGRSMPQKEVGLMFKVRPDVIGEVLLGKTWKHVRPDLPRYEPKHFSLLSESDVLEIIRLGGIYSQKDLAKMFHVRSNTISRILSGQRWKHISRYPKNANHLPAPTTDVG